MSTIKDEVNKIINQRQFSILQDNSEKVNKEIEDQMYSYRDTGDPKVGIFWFDTDELELFNVMSCDIKYGVKGEFGITLPKLHKDIWTKEYYRAVNKKKLNKPYNPIYLQDYTQIPRGRVFYDTKSNEFRVYVGSWYKEYENVLKDLIKSEFDLKDFKFVVLKHWELGHGWTERF